MLSSYSVTTQNRQEFSLSVQQKGTGYPILCLHGHPGSADCLQVFTQGLSQHYRTLAPDLRGYGRSRAQADFAMTDHVNDLARVLEQYRFDQGIVLGWSLGGILALELALQFPEKVKGLILVATAARPRGNYPRTPWQADLYTGIAALINSAAPGWTWNIQTFGVRSQFRYLIRQHNPATYRYLATAAVPAFLKTSRQANRALTQALTQGYDRLNDLHRINCPCLVLAGACDRNITPESSHETATALAHSQWVCYPDTAHLFPWEIPHQVQQDIQTWLAQHPTAKLNRPT